MVGFWVRTPWGTMPFCGVPEIKVNGGDRKERGTNTNKPIATGY
jgi:hypothetical protein